MNPFILASLLGFKHALDPDHLAAVFNLSLSGRMNYREAARLGFSWGIGHAATMLLLGLPVVLLTASLPLIVYQLAELLVGVIIVYLGLKLFTTWFKGSFHPHEVIKISQSHLEHHRHHKRSTLMGALHGVGGSYPGALLVMASFGTPLAASIGLVVFVTLSILSMTVVTTMFSIVSTHHKLLHVMDRLLIPAFICVTLWFGYNYTLGAL